jgi:hypothetical protein
MLEFLRGKASDRKLRLFAVACCQSVWQWLADERSRNGVEAAECYADNPGMLAQLGEARDDSLRAMEDAAGDSESAVLGHTKWHAATAVVFCTDIPCRWDSARDGSQEARQAESCHLFESVHLGVEVPFPEPDASDGSAHAALLRDIFGSLFCPCLPLPPAVLAWNDGTARRIAENIYEGRAFDRLPILADALLDAGCDNEELIAHCRGEGPHVRGCWAVDLILGKS